MTLLPAQLLLALEATPYYQVLAPASYQYSYQVQDQYANVNYGQEEGRNNEETKGQYHVLLPDGRVQTVTYKVGDAYSGYVANVEYSGYSNQHTPGPK